MSDSPLQLLYNETQALLLFKDLQVTPTVARISGPLAMILCPQEEWP